jgi:hypothetical protein
MAYKIIRDSSPKSEKWFSRSNATIIGDVKKEMIVASG